MLVDKNGQQWKVGKSLGDFRQLSRELTQQFSNYELTQIPEEWLAFTKEDAVKNDLKVKLQSYLIVLSSLLITFRICLECLLSETISC